jgi:two-component system response regulator AtoC
VSTTKDKRILIVDDEEYVRILLSELLQREGFSCDQAGNGKEALERLEQEQPTLILMDIRMPVLSGMEVFRIIREKWPQISVIMMTAFAGVDTAVEAMKLGAFNYISKPFNNSEILVNVKRALEIQELTKEVITLREAVSNRFSINNIIGKSLQMQEVFKNIGRVAPSNSTVLIEGESGTGKELIARSIHFNSNRSKGPLVTINCAAIPEHLLENELFGHEKGSFTGAISSQQGKFEIASGGTIFLDEISEMSPNLQAKLLRVLQDREFHRIGGTTAVRADVRMIAACNVDLAKAIELGTFREDLFYRLNVVRIQIPPLRQRREDIPLLVDHFISQLNQQGNKRVQSIDAEAMEILCRYDWPGNVRELENAVECALVMGQGGVLMKENLPAPLLSPPRDTANNTINIHGDSLKEMLDNTEKKILLSHLEQLNWNRVKTAEKLKMSRKALIYKIEKYALHPAKP